MEHHLGLALLIAIAALSGASEGGLFQRRQAEASAVSETVNSTVEFGYNDPYYACQTSKHENCIVPNLDQYESQLSDLRSARVFIQTRSNLEQLAASLETTKTCLRNESAQPSCQNVSGANQIDFEVAFVADFLSSSENLDVIMGVSSSICLSFPRILHRAEDDFADCVGTMYAELQQPETIPCDAVHNVRLCFIHTTQRYCGTEAGTFVATVWDTMVHSDTGRAILEDSPLPTSLLNQCYQQAGVVKRFYHPVQGWK